MAEVLIKNVSKRYPGGVTAVDRINLAIQDMELLVLVGPSGCGKSTMLRMVAGLEEISEGEISIGNTVVNNMPPKDRDIAMVFQNYALYPHMNVYNNMAFSLKLRKFSKADIDTRVRETAQILGISELLDRKPKALSGGQRQRVAVGRAIVRKPKVFLLDEPLSNLDAKMRVEMRAELNKLHHRLQTTMIYVTHDQIEAMTLGDRVVIMKDGIIQQVGAPISVYDFPENRFVASFIGTPPMNFFAGKLVSENGGIYFEEGYGRIRMPEHYRDALSHHINGKVELGIRPEKIKHLPPSSEERTQDTLKAKVEVVEHLGAEMMLYLRSPSNAFLAKVDAHHTAQVDQEMRFTVDSERLHVFDAETGQNLTVSAARRHLEKR